VSAQEVVDFLAQLDIEGANGLQVVLVKWLENSINFAGYDEIRQKYVILHPLVVGCRFWTTAKLPISVIALSKLYDLKDPRLGQIMVKGDLIVPENDGRIMTRSRARASKCSSSFLKRVLGSGGALGLELDDLLDPEDQHVGTEGNSEMTDPDRYTSVPANLKILKVLIVELAAASGANINSAAAAAAQVTELADDPDSDEDWEDEGNVFQDLGTSLSKEQLMAFAEEGPAAYAQRMRDDDTQAFLVEWFKHAAQSPGFAAEFEALNEDEKGKLRALE